MYQFYVAATGQTRRGINFDSSTGLKSPNGAGRSPDAAWMTEYLAKGASLGWLIDHKNRQVYVYRPQYSVECLENPEFVEGKGVIVGFRLDRAKIW